MLIRKTNRRSNILSYFSWLINDDCFRSLVDRIGGLELRMVRCNIGTGSEKKGDLKVSAYRNATFLITQAFSFTDFRVFSGILACSRGVAIGISRDSPR